MARSGTFPAPVHEESLRFGEAGSLFGILSEPVGGLSTRRPAVLFLNVGANHRVGPGRMYVSLARDMAALGYLAFRFDVAGLGDSQADAGRERQIYSPDSVRDVRAAVAMLAARRGVERVVLVGVCSGAYLAFHAGLADPRVAGQILINPQTFEWKESDSVELDPQELPVDALLPAGPAAARGLGAGAAGRPRRPRRGRGAARAPGDAGRGGARGLAARLCGEPPPSTGSSARSAPFPTGASSRCWCSARTMAAST